ncbi:GNAT family N-acetyltransferase [Streptomyces yangpuensis]|uniref:GNAT family N-acetyltransferase n=1 Tax=Streptomyces yangpuensis TaxID=1648182 RepID=A0ABY5PYI5_9ACTN|nr:GNAT family protein [Streptomyces yangpuensis]UUY48558.1 GNAT family N-acetyltransferase [Streptomyces yangpuensis]
MPLPQPLALRPFHPLTDAPVLRSWIPDPTALMTWAGPNFTWPLTDAQLTAYAAEPGRHTWTAVSRTSTPADPPADPPGGTAGGAAADPPAGTPGITPGGTSADTAGGTGVGRPGGTAGGTADGPPLGAPADPAVGGTADGLQPGLQPGLPLGTPLGHISLADGRLGRVLIAPGARGRGLGEQLVTLAVSIAFDELVLPEIRLGVWSHNTAALRVYEKLGFRTTATLEAVEVVDGVPWSVHRMRLTAADRRQ